MIDLEEPWEELDITHGLVVWRFEDAPQYLQDLSDHGGDEDWLALLSPTLKDEWIPWMESGSSFGVCRVSRYELTDGSVVAIGAHS